MSDVTLDDLKADQDAQTDDDGDSSSSGGEWVGDLIDRLDDRGYLDAIIAQQFDVQPTDMDMDTDTDGEAAAAQGGNDGVDLDAGQVAQFGKLVIDSVGDVPMSQVVKFAENNPERVNQIIEQATGGEQE